MEIGAYIEERLVRQNLTKQDLHQLLKRVFSNEFPLAYNTFSQKIANNNLNALELFQIASVLDIDLNQLTNSLKQKFAISIEEGKEEHLNLDLDSSVCQLFFAKSPYLRQLREKQALDLNHFSFKIIKRHKNVYEMISFVFPECQFEKACRVELLDLDRQELRVVACADHFLGFNPHTLKTITEWEMFGERIKNESETYFTLFPEITRFESLNPHIEEKDLFNEGSLSDFFGAACL